jgi:dipeptidyl aminopeptidase/acylaminoacyl peptidase
MKKYSFITKFALIILSVIIAGCTKDIPDKYPMDAIPAPPAIKITSSTVKDNQEITPEHSITVSFNNIMDAVVIDISGVKGNTNLDTTYTSATFKPFSKIAEGRYTMTVTGVDEYGQEITKTITFVVTNNVIIVTSSSMIAYTSNLDGDYEIYLIKTDGSEMTQLTSNFAQDTHPVWSPDGRFIVFCSDRDGVKMWNSDIFIMRADGTTQTNLTDSQFINEFAPCWSYDGKKILYQTDLHGFNEYYVMNSDGTNSRPMEDADVFDFAYPWMFDEDMLISDNTSGNYEIYLEPFFGGKINLTNHFANDTYPAWSSDGSKIVFVSDRDFNNEIYIMDADGTNQKRLTRNFVDDSEPSWSPF